MKTPEFFSTTIPFSGFYCSFHSEMIESCEEQMFTGNNGMLYLELVDDFFHHVDYKKVEINYAKEYTKSFAKEFDLNLKFEEMSSPRFYNFETDRIFVRITRSDLAKMLWKVKGKPLKEKALQRHTSHSGFSSFYSNNINDWGRIATWDHNQIGTVVYAYIDLMCDNWINTEESLVSDFNSNGLLDEWLYSASDREGRLLLEFASILRRVFN